LVGSRTRIVTLVIGSVILGALVGIAHVLWTRSAESEIVHYSWPVKWALTFAAESPDLPPGSRFSTAAVTKAQGEQWVVAGQVELPSSEGRRLTTTYTADVRSRCSSFSERRCWEMAGLSLGSVPAATGLPLAQRQSDERDGEVQVAALPGVAEPPPSDAEPPPQQALEAEQDLDFVLGEPLIQPTDELLEALGGWSTIRSPHASSPRYDHVLVRDIQRGLTKLGYNAGPADGVPGRKTRAAVEAFRKHEGLARAAMDFELLDRIMQRLSGPTAAADASSAPAPTEASQPAPAARSSWRCAGVNPKVRDCDG
jgi:hypothetical protein